MLGWVGTSLPAVRMENHLIRSGKECDALIIPVVWQLPQVNYVNGVVNRNTLFIS